MSQRQERDSDTKQQCPTCDSYNRKVRYEIAPHILDDQPCRDPWHDSPVEGAAGSGEREQVDVCDCGATGGMHFEGCPKGWFRKPKPRTTQRGCGDLDQELTYREKQVEVLQAELAGERTKREAAERERDDYKNDMVIINRLLEATKPALEQKIALAEAAERELKELQDVAKIAVNCVNNCRCCRDALRAALRRVTWRR